MKEALFLKKNSHNEIWRRGHRRIWIDNMIYSSWVSAKLKCGYSTDSNFATHLLSLEMRTRQARAHSRNSHSDFCPCCIPLHLTIDLFFTRGNNPAFACSTTLRKKDTADDPSSKCQRHFEAEICFPGMFYVLLFKMLALFERLADSGYSTYNWFSLFFEGLTLYYNQSQCVFN